MERFLSPKEFADAVGVSESSLKRWADDGLIKVHRTAGGHRRIAMAEALRYIRDAGLPVVKPAILGFGELWHVAKPVTQSDAALKQAIKDGFAELARSLVLSAYLSGRMIAELCDHPIRDAMHEVGELWKHGPEGIAVEHRALHVTLTALNFLRGLLPPPDAAAPLALGAAVENDPYELPTLMVATVLSAAGWRTINFGPHLPVPALSHAVREHEPQLVWLSCSVFDAATHSRSAVREMGAMIAQHGGSLLVGGRGWEGTRIDGPGITPVTSMGEVAAFAEGLQAAAT